MYKLYLKILVLSAAFTIISCGTNSEPYVSPILMEHVRLFENTYSIKIDFDVVVANLEPEYVGMCTVWSDGSKKIEISAKYISTMPSSLIEETVLHELGHCVLGRDHEDSFMYRAGAWIPRSIMYSYVHPNHEKYEQNKNWYLNELINP